MYDWPEIHGAMDQLWDRLKNECLKHGLPAPQLLQRSDDLMSQWQSPLLLLGQTCGLPYLLKLKSQVQLIGSGCYRVEDARTGDYNSVIVARKSTDAENILSDPDSRFAANEKTSLSGFIAPLAWLSAKRPKASLGKIVFTSAHRKSIQSVADNEADFASIDAVSWALANRYEPATQQLHVIGKTNPLPGLPFICSHEFNPDTLAEALSNTLKYCDTDIRNTLLLEGFRCRQPEEYEVIKDVYDQADSVMPDSQAY